MKKKSFVVSMNRENTINHYAEFLAQAFNKKLNATITAEDVIHNIHYLNKISNPQFPSAFKTNDGREIKDVVFFKTRDFDNGNSHWEIDYTAE
jgi:hypothetical protein